MHILRTVFVMLLMLALGASGLALTVFDLDAGRIQADTEYLCNVIGIRETGTPAEKETADWIEKQLSDMGYDTGKGDLFRWTFHGMKEKTSENLGVILNADDSHALVTIVAHYDTVPTSCGARDNSTSVAILLEMARYFSENGVFPGCEVRLVFLGSEENGYHGARAYVKSLSEADRLRHIAAFNMDISVAAPSENTQLVMNILGGKDASGKCVDADYLPALENTVTRYIQSAHKALYGGEPVPVFYHGESDHVPFHDAGLEAANICQRSVSEGRPLLPESYHTMDDTTDGLDYSTAVVTGRCILNAISLIADEAVDQ